MNGETVTELSKLLGDISEKTGTRVSLKPVGGEETKFTLSYDGAEVTAYVEGTGSEAETAARLVRYFVSNADVRVAVDRQESLKNILLGEGSAYAAFRFLTKYNIADAPCFALDIVPERLGKEAAAHIERCVEESCDLVVRMDDKRIGVVKFTADGQTSYEFGQFLFQSLYEELGVRASVGIGCEVKSFSEIAVSYAQAATAVRMSGMFHSDWEVHSYREYLLVRMLEDVPASRLKDYMEQFRIEEAAEVFEDEDMTATAEAFLDSSLNISETSRNLFMHRNTLMYRLDKIERVTGLNIRKFSDAVTFRVITILHKLLQS